MGTLLVKLALAGAVTTGSALLLKQMIHTGPIVAFILCAAASMLVYVLVLLLTRCRELTDLLANIRDTLRRKAVK